MCLLYWVNIFEIYVLWNSILIMIKNLNQKSSLRKKLQVLANSLTFKICLVSGLPWSWISVYMSVFSHLKICLTRVQTSQIFNKDAIFTIYDTGSEWIKNRLRLVATLYIWYRLYLLSCRLPSYNLYILEATRVNKLNCRVCICYF